MAHFTKPDEGSWTAHYPQLRTTPSGLRRLDLARLLRTRAAGRLRQDLAQRGARRADPSPWLLLHQGDRGPQHVDHRRAVLGGRRPRRSTTSAGTEGTSWSGRTSHRKRPPVSAASSPASTTGGDTTSRERARSSSRKSEFFDLEKADYGLVPVHCEMWEGWIFVNLDREGTPQPLREYLGAFADGNRRLPVPRDDPGPQVPGRGREQLEALHRRLHRVLPCARAAREAVQYRRNRRSYRTWVTRRSTTRSTDRTVSSLRGAAWHHRRTR